MNILRKFLSFSAFTIALLSCRGWSQETNADICIYGGTSAGVTAAVEAARSGRTVVLVEPGQHLGGMSVEGLGGSDIDNHKDFKNSHAFGGLARDFYLKLGEKYGKPGQQQWKFEPHVAATVFNEWVQMPGLQVLRGERLREPFAQAVEKQGAQVVKIRLESGRTVAAKVFIDCTFEGDLLAASGVSTRIGREANREYGETKNGIRGETTHAQFQVKVDPYKVPGDPKSGVIPTIQDEPLGTPGDGDHRLQAYCFRMCLTKNPDNRIPFTKPANFDRGNYEIYLRYIRAGGKLWTPGAGLPNGKTDLGSWHDLSANLYGMNFEYPGGDYATRKRVLQEHLTFTQGLVWFLANDPEVPEKLRTTWAQWGVCKDEFQDNGGWPRIFYVRDARRMVSDYVITEKETRRTTTGEDRGFNRVPDSVAVAYWPPDTHSVRRIVRDGAAYNEGFVFGGKDWAPFGVGYRALVPKAAEATNVLTATCPSSTHVAYGAIRIEFTFMALGQAVGAAAVQAIEQNVPVQKIDVARLQERLRAAGQVIELPTVAAQ